VKTPALESHNEEGLANRELSFVHSLVSLAGTFWVALSQEKQPEEEA
jgi:hypothetical protein